MNFIGLKIKIAKKSQNKSQSLDILIPIISTQIQMKNQNAQLNEAAFIKYKRPVGTIFAILNQKIHRSSQCTFNEIKKISIQKSPQFIALKSAQLAKKINIIYILKLRHAFDSLVSNLLIIQTTLKQTLINQAKIKDKIYDTKVKALRILSRQWKEKKSQNIYKNKYFTPKPQQTPKMQKEKVVQQMYLSLRNALRQKYLQAFSIIKLTEYTKIKNSKTLYLTNYLAQKRKHWLTFGMLKLKIYGLRDKYKKQNQEILLLQTKIASQQDPQILGLRQKQQKLQSALDGVLKEKQAFSLQADNQMNDIQSNLQEKRKQIKELKNKKQMILQTLLDYRKKTQNFEFTREEVFYLVYTHFLCNLRLWDELSCLSQNYTKPIFSRNLAQQWLQCPVIEFHLDKFFLNSSQLQEIISRFNQMLSQYKRLRENDVIVEFSDIVQCIFSEKSVNESSNSYEEILNKNKFMHKILSEILIENQILMADSLNKIKIKHKVVTQGNTEVIY